MSKQIFKSSGKLSLFDRQNKLEQINGSGKILPRLNEVVDFEIFRELLEESLINKVKLTNVGAKPYDFVLMFKITILQRLYNLSDEEVEFQMIDRLSFQNFLKLSSGDTIPDARTIWKFKEQLTKKGLVEKLFALFHNFLKNSGLILNEGKMVDASFVLAPRQRNTREENAQIKEGKGDELWQGDDDKNKLAQKDTDARWVKKGGEKHYGYKDHAKVDSKSKFIDSYTVTSAEVHDSKELPHLLTKDDAGQPFYADSAYSGKPLKRVIKKMGLINRVHEKGVKGKPLTKRQKTKNTKKSTVRARVEHVFGFMEQTMKGLFVRTIGIVRATATIGLMNLTYNISRYEQIVRLKLIEVKK